MITHLPNTPRPRTMAHPGPVNPIRIQAEHAERGRSFRFSIMPGQTLYDGLTAPLAALGIASASTTVLGGWFRELKYCVCPPDPTGQRIAAYSAPRHVENAFLVFGNATIGRGANSRILVHCHGAVAGIDMGPRGGHILTDAAIVADRPIPVLLTALDGIELTLVHDDETNMPIMTPRRSAAL
jgi:hypothetical protein